MLRELFKREKGVDQSVTDQELQDLDALRRLRQEHNRTTNEEEKAFINHVNSVEPEDDGGFGAAGFVDNQVLNNLYQLENQENAKGEKDKNRNPQDPLPSLPPGPILPPGTCTHASNSTYASDARLLPSIGSDTSSKDSHSKKRNR